MTTSQFSLVNERITLVQNEICLVNEKITLMQKTTENQIEGIRLEVKKLVDCLPTL